MTVDQDIAALEQRTLPAVLIAPNDIQHDSPYVDMDDAGAACEMTEHLIGLGHRRIGFIIGHPNHFASSLRLRGYRQALEQHHIPFDAACVKQGYFVFESGLEAARELLTLPNPPTAIARPGSCLHRCCAKRWCWVGKSCRPSQLATIRSSRQASTCGSARLPTGSGRAFLCC